MFLTKIDIKNFRGIEEISISLDDLCVLIGENNAGKSSILDAIRICLTRSLTRRGAVFDEYDYHLKDASSEPSNSDPINITLTFAETKEDEWPDEISQLLPDAEQIDSDGLRSVTLRVTSYFDPSVGEFATDYVFLDLSGNPLVKAKDYRHLNNLQKLVPTFYLSSLRDAAQEFRAKSTFWRPFIRTLKLDDKDRKLLEADLLELNKKVLKGHTSFEEVRTHLEKTAKLLPFGDSEPVSIEAIPHKIFDILSRTQVYFASKTGAKIPIVRHGGGAQSLAVISLFDAFLQSQLEEKYSKVSEPLLALEEPEAHLHPSAIKAIAGMLQDLSGQKLISTHSGDLLSSMPLKNIRRLRRIAGKITIHALQDDVLTEDEINKLDYHVRSTRGSLLFSRCWLLVEGETEALLLSECGRSMGHDLYADGVSCVEFVQVGVEKFIKLADQLGIEWFVLADGDSNGERYANSARQQLAKRNENKHIKLLDHGSMELFLCMEKFGNIYEAAVSEQKMDKITEKTNTVEYWRQVVNAQQKNSKTRNALTVAEQIVQQGKDSIPQLLQNVIEQTRTLARSAG